MMPTGETTNALLQLTDGGLWLKAMQGLLVKINTCSVYSSGEGTNSLQYKTFAAMWKKYAGPPGFIDKARVKDFEFALRSFGTREEFRFEVSSGKEERR